MTTVFLMWVDWRMVGEAAAGLLDGSSSPLSLS
jgi:hypothetical protein